MVDQYLPFPNYPHSDHNWVKSSSGISDWTQESGYAKLKSSGGGWISRDLSEFDPGITVPTGTKYTLTKVQVMRVSGDADLSGLYFGGWNKTYGEVRYVSLNLYGLRAPIGQWITLPNITLPVNATDDYLGSSSTEAALRVVLYTGAGTGYWALTNFKIWKQAEAPDSSLLDNNDSDYSYTAHVDSLLAEFNHGIPNEMVTRLRWNWDDASADTYGFADLDGIKNPSHTFPTAGTYNITVTAENTIVDDNGGTEHVNQTNATVKSVAIPSGSFTAAFTYDGTYRDVDVDASSSIGFVDTYTWDWGDSSPNTNGEVSSHTYAADGTYIVTLTITNSLGQSDTVTHSFTAVGIPSSTVNFTVVRTFLSVDFISTHPATAGTYLWTFGDGATSTLENPNHIYATAGTYTATFQYTEGAVVSSISKVLTVNETFTTLDRVIEYLRLEVELPPGVNTPFNLVKNPNGELGGYFWNTPVSGSALTGNNSDNPAELGGFIEGWKLIYTATGDGVAQQRMVTDLFRVDANDGVRASLQVPYISDDQYYRVKFSYYDLSSVFLSDSAYTGYLSASAGSVRTAALTAPVNTYYATMTIEFYADGAGTDINGAFSAIVRRVMISTAVKENLLTNGSFDSNINNWDNVEAGTNCTKEWNSSAQRLRAICSSAGTIKNFNDDYIPVDIGESISASVVAYSAGTVRSSQINLYYYDSSQTFHSSVAGVAVNDGPAGVALTKSSTIIPSGVSYVRFEVQRTLVVLDEIHDIDDAVILGYPRWFQFLVYSDSENWLDFLDSAFEIHISREELSLGQMTTSILDTELDPATADILRPGRQLRLRAQTEDPLGNVKYESLFVGEIDNAEVTYLRQNNIWVPETGRDQVILRRNWFYNPSFENNLDAWGDSTLFGARDVPTAQVISNTHFYSGGFSAKISVPASTIGTWWGQLIDNVPADIFSVSIKVWLPAGHTATFIAANQAFGVTGNDVSGTTGAWVTTALTLDRSAETGPASIYFGIDIGPTTAPFDLWVDACLAEVSAIAGEYFDGYTIDNAESSFGWDDPILLSDPANIDTQSIQYIPAVPFVAGHYEAVYEQRAADVELIAFDVLTKLTRDSESRGVRYISELPFILEGKDAPYEVNGSSAQIATATVVSSNESASIVDQVAITRDSDHGFAFVNRNNVLIAFDSTHVPTTVVRSLDEDDYTGIDVNFNTNNCINEITIKYLRFNEVESTTEEVAYGPYRLGASVDEWGLHSAEFTIQGITESEFNMSAFADEVFTANGTPVVRVNALRFPVIYAEDLVPGKALIDLYDLVNVKYSAKSIDHDVRVVAIEQQITLRSWDIAIGFAPNGAVASPQVTPTSTATPSTTTSTVTRPIGEVTMWYGAKADIPSGWLPFDGTVFDELVYPELFTLLGTNSLPNMEDKFPIGAGAVKTKGSVGGAAAKVLTAANMPPHAHSGPAHTHAAGTLATDNPGDHVHQVGTKAGVGSQVGAWAAGNSVNATNGNTNAAGGHTHAISGATASDGTGNTGNGTGSSTPVDILNPWHALWFIIRAR